VSYVFVGPIVNTGASTIDVDGRGVKAITKFGTVPLVAGDIRAGQVCVVVYDGTRFQLLNPANFSPGIDRQFLRTNATPATVWESGYITPVASYVAIPGAGSAVTFSHGLGADPLTWDVGIICTDAGGDATYALNDYIPVGSIMRTDLSETDHRITSYSNSTVIGMVRGTVVSGIQVNGKTTGVLTPIDTDKWKVMARAIR
jgi:hypothetical protein